LSYARRNHMSICGKIKHPVLGCLIFSMTTGCFESRCICLCTLPAVYCVVSSCDFRGKRIRSCCDHSMISVTRPAPTVRPPSRIAKRRPFSIAIGLIRCTSRDTLSPGITISTPSGSFTSPVTSVVRK